MAKKLRDRTAPGVPEHPDSTSRAQSARPDRSLLEYDLIDDVVFDPPLTPEERRRRGVGIPIEERIEQVRRQLADGIDWS